MLRSILILQTVSKQFIHKQRSFLRFWYNTYAIIVNRSIKDDKNTQYFVISHYVCNRLRMEESSKEVITQKTCENIMFKNWGISWGS